jgi:hypothetical protein
MPLPTILARVEQANDPPGFKIKGCDVGPLEKITFKTSPGKIRGSRWSAMFASYDVIRLVGQQSIFLMEQTILAVSA